MINLAHENKILANIEELNYCFECSKDLFPMGGLFNSCPDCERSYCATCARCACFATAEAATKTASTAQRLLEGGAERI